VSRADVLVAGGGPTGLAAAITAATQGASVIVIDPHEGVIDKACGEGLMPGGLRILRALGVDEGAVDGVPFVGIRYQHAEHAALSAAGRFPGEPGRGVRRTTLHEALRQRAADLGIQWVKGRIDEIEAREREVRAGGWTASWLIAADGLHSPIRRKLGLELPSREPVRFGVRRHFHVAPWSDRVEVYFAPHVEAYVTPVTSSSVGVAFLYAPPARFDDLLPRFPHLAARLTGAATASTTRGAGPFRQRVRRRVSGRVLLAGDAAGYLDPLTGEGVSLGMASGALAVECALAGDASSYERRYAKLTRSYRVLTTALLAVVRRPALHRPLLHAARALPVVFDAALRELAAVSHSLPLERRQHSAVVGVARDHAAPARIEGQRFVEHARRDASTADVA